MLSNLKSKTNQTFQMETEMEFEIDDIDDLKNAVEEKLDNDENVKFNSQFTFDLFVKMEHLNDNNTPETQFKLKHQLNNINNTMKWNN